GVDVLRLLQGGRAPGEPHSARPAAHPAGQRLSLLPGLQPRFHGGLLTVTAESSATEAVLSAPARGVRWAARRSAGATGCSTLWWPPRPSASPRSRCTS